MTGSARESAVGQLPLTRWQRVRSQIRHALENWFFKTCFPGSLIQKKYASFQRLRRGDRQALELISRLEEIQQKRLACDIEYIKHLCRLLDREVQELVEALVAFNPIKYALLRNYHRKYAFYVNLALMEEGLEEGPEDGSGGGPPHVLKLSNPLSENLAGGKGCTLSTLLTTPGVPVPPGLAITPAAFYLLLHTNGLVPLIQEQLSRLSPDFADSEETLKEVSRTLQTALLASEKPETLEVEVQNGLSDLGIADTPLALRSSAVGEDLQASFAGQFESQLGVHPDNWFEAYKKILASKYSPHALFYRISQGFTDRMTPMAVLIMPTIEAAVSGILYTRDPGGTAIDQTSQAVLYMVSGFGESLAAGSEYQARAVFDLNENRLEGTGPACPLAPDILTAIFQYGQALEALFGLPQDVEWVVDQQGQIFIVQSRPLRMAAGPAAGAQSDTSQASASDSMPQSPYPAEQILGRGQWVSSGKASGRVYKPGEAWSVSEIPDQAILVTDELPPNLALALNKVRAVVAEKGSPACHFASLAREAGITVLCNVRESKDLEDGQTVSVDSDQGVILDGRLFSSESGAKSAAVPETPVFKKLSKALASISPLSLQDPDTDDFSIQSCSSLHDIVRYVHEAGVREMFSLVGRRGIDSYGARRLISGLPLVMHVLDVNSGLSAEGRSGKAVQLAHVRSQPMRKLFEGLSSPAVEWNENILHYDWDAYAKSSGAFVDVEKSTMFSSYAIVDMEYLHALLRFGYHFAVLDTVLGPEAEQNYIHFSFKGGGGNEEQRYFRLQLISQILTHFHFNVKITADLLEAAFDRRPQTDTGANLYRLGIVLGKTVLLDMRLKNEAHVRSLAESIIQEVYGFFTVQENS